MKPAAQPPPPPRRAFAAVLLSLALAATAGGSIASAAPGPGSSPQTGTAPTVVRTVYTTAYSWYDNTPTRSVVVQYPMIHQSAGGTGTYADPVTIAVGHSTATGRDVLDYPAGTRIYLPDVRRYFIVEDSCGDGADPEDGPCHQGENGGGSGSTIWLDLWIGGRTASASSILSCESKVTDGDGALHTAVFNPAPGYAVAPGVGIYHDGRCDAGYGNQLVRTADALPMRFRTSLSAAAGHLSSWRRVL